MPARLRLDQPCQRGCSLSLLLVQPWDCPVTWGGIWHSHLAHPFARFADAQWPSGACVPPAVCRTAAFWLHQQWRQWAYVAQDSPKKKSTNVHAFLWSFDHSLQPTSHTRAANPTPLGLWVTRQEVSQKLVCLGNSLIVSRPGFFDHLLSLAELQLVGLLILLGTCTLRPIWLLEIL